MMKKHYIFLLIAYVCGFFELNAQCTVNITQPAHLPAFICSGGTLTLSATGSGPAGGLVLDQSQLSYNAGTSARTLAGYSEWQSFTAGITGTLAEIDMGFFNAINGSGQLNVFAGSGTGGTLLYTASVNVVCASGNCLIPFTVSAPVVAGQMYSFQFIPGAGIPDPYGVQAEVPGTYAGGEMNLVDPSGTYPTGFDMIFKTWVQGSGGSVTYHWSTGGTDSTISIHAPGEYYVTGTTGGSCTAVDSIRILKDSIALSAIASATTCGFNNGAATVHAAGGILPYSVNWSNTSHSDTLRNLQAGSYYVTVTDSIGCRADDSVSVGPSSPLVLYLSSQPIPFCGNDSTEYCVIGGFASYHWSNGVNDSCIWVYSSGSYSLTVTDASSCSASAGPVVFVALPPPVAFVAAHHDTLIASTGTSYQWYLNGQPLPPDTFQVLVAHTAGSYAVQVTDSNGCQSLSDHHAITGIEAILNSSLEIWPNPAFNEWNVVTGTAWLNADVCIFDAQGKLVYTSKITAPVLQINPYLSSGIYLMQISSSVGTLTRKLVKL